MTPRVFVDTSGWHAVIDKRDADHARVSAVVQQRVAGGWRLVTTDYVIDESCTLAKARSGSLMAFRLLDFIRDTSALDIEWIDAERFDGAEAEFRKYDDQGFSFTDCASFVVMRQRGISDVITLDDHFRTAGFQPTPGRPSPRLREGVSEGG